MSPTYRFLRAAAVLAAASIISPNLVALAKDFTAGAITIEGPWSRATPSGAKVAAGYFTIKNSGDGPDRLVSVTVDIPQLLERRVGDLRIGMD
jgi:copper(I)-binding protein